MKVLGDINHSFHSTYAALIFGIRKSLAYRASLVMDTVAALVMAGVSVVFWQVLFSHGKGLPGLSLAQVFVFLMYVEVFFVVTGSCFAIAGKTWRIIHSGKLDAYLVRPGSARTLLLLTHVRLDYLLRGLPTIVLFGWLAWWHNAPMSTAGLVIGFLLSIAAAFCFALLQLAGSWLAFYLGRSEFIDEFTDSLLELLAYPHQIFPTWLQGVLLFVLPFGYAATKAQIVASGNFATLHMVVSAIAVTITGWFVIQNLLWTQGLKRYDSPNP